MSSNVLFRYPCISSQIKYEFVCPNCAADVATLDQIPDFDFDEYLECEICGEQFTPTESDIWFNIVKKEAEHGA